MLKSRQARLTYRETVRQVKNIHKYYIACLLTLKRVQKRDAPLKSRAQSIPQVHKHARNTIMRPLQKPHVNSKKTKKYTK